MGAEAGDVDAQYKLACFCERGVGVPADIHAAFALYTAAAAQDDPDAILALGVCYNRGSGVARDVPRAIALCERVLAHPRADPQAVAAAALILAVAYWNGDDSVLRDRKLGARYLIRAATLGNVTAARYLRELGLA